MVLCSCWGGDPGFSMKPREDVAVARAHRSAAQVRYEDYGQPALERARSQHRFILLHGAAEWCHWCHVMEETTYRDPAVVALLQQRFVTIKVVFQCKRYSGSVGRPQVAEFRNSVMGRAEKGIIITTGTFTSEAIREATRDGVIPIELVDGEKLFEMFKRYELGLKPRTVYDIDVSFFEQFE